MSKVKTRWFVCPHDGYKTKVKESLIKHIIYKHTEAKTLYGCPLCDFSSKDRRHVVNHTLSEHVENKIKVLSENYICYCDFKTENYDDFKNHIENHHL